jgi:predicted ATP-grasp superfamily ATP-dependent carboligase
MVPVPAGIKPGARGQKSLQAVLCAPNKMGVLVSPPDLLILGASARAAAFSALRAGLHPSCFDLYGDADLRSRCPATAVSPRRYPAGVSLALKQAPRVPWMYTGGFENHPSLIRRLARARPLWGNNAESVRLARSPAVVARLLADAGLPCPALRLHPGEIPSRSRWLCKPLRGSGGKGLEFWNAQRPSRRRGLYFQEYIEGQACAAAYVADGHRANLLGVTRQLVGESWLFAEPFHYCGSVGPLPLAETVLDELRRLGSVLARGCGLRGLFGVDFILRDDRPWLVEVNPRYTASMEVIEYAQGLSLLDLHRQVFGGSQTVPVPEELPATPWVGKAILFARKSFVFPELGPWSAVLSSAAPVTQLPMFADIPPAGQAIAIQHPILTVFTAGPSEAACLESLRKNVQALDPCLFGR